MSDSDRTRQIRESWDHNAALWTRTVRGGGIESRLEGTNQAVLDAVRETQARKILDVGCGEGWLVHLLEAVGCEVTGFDGSADLIASAKTGSGRFIHLDYDAFAQDPTVVGENFDAAVCNFSLFEEHIDSYLKAIASRLASGGCLIVQTVHPVSALGEGSYEDGWRTESFRSLDSEFREMPWYFRTLGSWIDVLGRAGFVLARCGEPLSEKTRMPLSMVLSCRMRR